MQNIWDHLLNNARWVIDLDLGNLAITTRVNDAVGQHGPTADLTHVFASAVNWANCCPAT